MRRVIVFFFSSIGAMVFFSVVLALFALSMSRKEAAGVPDVTILEADLSGGLLEYTPEDPIAKALQQRQLKLRGVISALERAADDDRVVALVVRVGGGFGYAAKVQELRDAILHFRSKGKRAVAWVEDFPMGNRGTINYYLASAFDEIHLQPLGSVHFGGLSMEAPFIKEALAKLEIDVQMDSRSEYKNMKNTFTETEFTAEHRESFARIIESTFDRIAQDVARERNLKVDEVNAIANRANLLSYDAKALGLIDEISYRDEAYAAVRRDLPEAAELLFLGHYLARSDAPPDDSPVLALIYGVGNVVQGKSVYDPLSGQVTMGSDTVAAAFRQAVQDDDVRAIVFRIDSGGGSAVASQIMWRETLRAKQAGKPVIATMGDVAGSGGYYVAMGADKIVAQPGTLTGSIGVVFGKFVTRNFWERWGVSFDEVETNPNALMWSSNHSFDKEQWRQLQRQLDYIYQIFTEGVAEGRNLSSEDVERLARGRIWTGSDAYEAGLVDALGGFDTAIQLAKEAAGIDADTPVQLRSYPLEKTPLELLTERLGGASPSNSEEAVVGMLGSLANRLRPLVKLADEVGLGNLTSSKGELQMDLRGY
jgi:protease-4